MDNFEKVEKLREHANVTYEEAKEALENSNWDILDAMIYLEKNGKTRESQRAEYSTKTERCVGEVIDDGKEERRSNFKDSMHRFAKWCSHILDKGNSNSFCVEKDDKEIFRIPITVLVLLLLFAFWVVLPLLIIGLFLNMRYHFQGPDMHAVDLDINKAMDSAAETAENIKNGFSQAVSKDEK